MEKHCLPPVLLLKHSVIQDQYCKYYTHFPSHLYYIPKVLEMPEPTPQMFYSKD